MEKHRREKPKNQFIEVLGRLSMNKGAMLGMIILLAIVVLAFVAPLIMPYDYNQMDIQNKFLGPCKEHLF